MAVDLRTTRPTPRQVLAQALAGNQEAMRAFENLQADLLLLAALVEALTARVKALETP